MAYIYVNPNPKGAHIEDNPEEKAYRVKSEENKKA